MLNVCMFTVSLSWCPQQKEERRFNEQKVLYALFHFILHLQKVNKIPGYIVTSRYHINHLLNRSPQW